MTSNNTIQHQFYNCYLLKKCIKTVHSTCTLLCHLSFWKISKSAISNFFSNCKFVKKAVYTMNMTLLCCMTRKNSVSPKMAYTYTTTFCIALTRWIDHLIIVPKRCTCTSLTRLDTCIDLSITFFISRWIGDFWVFWQWPRSGQAYEQPMPSRLKDWTQSRCTGENSVAGI